MTCSVKTPPVASISQLPGVAETCTVCGRIASHSSKRSGRLSMQEGRRKPYSAKRRLAPEVASIHAADLRDGDVALVGEDQRIVRQILEQGRRRLARQAAGQIARIVLDAGAGAGRLDHLDVEAAALLQPLRFQQAAGGFQLDQTSAQLVLDRGDRLVERRLRRHIVRIGVDLDEFQLGRLLPGQRVEFGDALDLVAEQRETPGAILQVGREDLDRIAAHPERAADAKFRSWRLYCSATRSAKSWRWLSRSPR
jgi:hypothetical protein